jgi:hypothetical protein
MVWETFNHFTGSGKTPFRFNSGLFENKLSRDSGAPGQVSRR